MKVKYLSNIAIAFFIIGCFFPLKKEFFGVQFYSVDLGVLLVLLVFILDFQNVIRMKKFATEFDFLLWFAIVFFIFFVFTFNYLFSFNQDNTLLIILDYFRLCLLFFFLSSYFHLLDIKKILTNIFYVILLIGFVQVFSGTDFGNLSSLFGSADKNLITFDGMQVRLSGTTNHPNLYSQLLTLGYVFSAFHLLETKKQYAFYFLFLLTVFIVASTLSRAALIVFTFVNLLIVYKFYITKENAVKFVFSAIICFAIFLFVYQFYLGESTIIQRFNSVEDTERSEFYQIAFSMLSNIKIFLFGTGFGGFFEASAQLGLGYSSDTRFWLDLTSTDISVHNVFLLYFIEGGLFIGAIFLMLYCKVLFLSVNSLLSKKVSAYEVAFLSSSLYFFVYMSPARFPMLFLYAVLFFCVLFRDKYDPSN